MTSNFLDFDASGERDEKLRFIKNKDEEELNQIFGFTGGNTSEIQNLTERPEDYKIVYPSPGLCMKCFKVNTNEKFFINICQTDGILAPENISEKELCEILQSEKPSTYRIPMSISNPRVTKDKSGNNVDVCDIAINPKFFKKCEKHIIFRDFLIAIILEAISEKYNIQLSADNWIILKNRKMIGTLISHRIENRDIKRVYDSYKNENDKDENKRYMEKINENVMKKSKKLLIEEIDIKEAEKIKKISSETALKYQQMRNQAYYRIYGNKKNFKIYEIVAEFYLPNLISEDEVSISVEENKITLISLEKKYYFSEFVPYYINIKTTTSSFNPDTKIIKIKMPLIMECYPLSFERCKQLNNGADNLKLSQKMCNSKKNKEQSNANTKINELNTVINFEEPKYKIYGRKRNKSDVYKIIADVWLPKCDFADEIYFSASKDRIFVQSLDKSYQLIKPILPTFLNGKLIIDNENILSKFSKDFKILHLEIPLVKL